MDNFEFCKEHYFFEINRKHQLTSSLALPVGLLTLIGGVLAYYFKFFVFRGGIIPELYSSILIVILFFIARTIYFLIRSYHNYTYSYIATPDVLLDYHKDLIEYHTKIGNNISQADEDLHKHVTEQYSKFTSVNTWNNDSKSEFLHKANTNLIYTFILVVVCSIPYFYLNNRNSTEKIHKIEITNKEVIKLKR